MPSVLITGAGRGLGFEFARQYAADGWRVIGTVRDPAKGAGLAAIGKQVQVYLLDVTDRGSIERLARELKGQAIDVLINCAGIYGPRGEPQAFGHVDWAVWADVMKTNVMAPLAVVESLVDHVAAGERKLVVMVSSQMGSIARAAGGSYMYRSSKAALNAVTRNLSLDLAPRGITVVSVHPGWVQTDMGGPSASLTPEKSVRGLRALLDRLDGRASGRFFNYDGEELPW